MSSDVSACRTMLLSSSQTVFSQNKWSKIIPICTCISAEKDSSTVLKLLPDPTDTEVNFVEVYGRWVYSHLSHISINADKLIQRLILFDAERPMYTIENLSGKPESLLRLGYPETGSKYYSIEHPSNSTGEIEPHKHYDPNFCEQIFKCNVWKSLCISHPPTRILNYSLQPPK